MNKKIVFFDIDGTLLDESTGTIPESCKKALKLAQDNGHILIVNTGRPVSTIDTNITKIHFDGYICGCGTYIKYQKKTILHATLSEKIRKEVIKQVFKCNVQAVLEGVEGAFFSKNITDPYILKIKQTYNEQNSPTSEYGIHDVVEFDKMAVWYDETSDIKSFKSFLSQYFEIIQRDTNFIEIVPINYSKATGIQYLIDYLGMDITQTISIGDSTNDLSMLEYTQESVAMGNSNPILFDKVTYITTDVDKDGIYNALKHYQII